MVKFTMVICYDYWLELGLHLLVRLLALGPIGLDRIMSMILGKSQGFRVFLWKCVSDYWMARRMLG